MTEAAVRVEGFQWTFFLAAGFAVALLAFMCWFWRFGLRHYTGAYP